MRVNAERLLFPPAWVDFHALVFPFYAARPFAVGGQVLERRAGERFSKYRKNTALGFCVAHLGVARLEAVGGVTGAAATDLDPLK